MLHNICTYIFSKRFLPNLYYYELSGGCGITEDLYPAKVNIIFCLLSKRNNSAIIKRALPAALQNVGVGFLLFQNFFQRSLIRGPIGANFLCQTKVETILCEICALSRDHPEKPVKSTRTTNAPTGRSVIPWSVRERGEDGTKKRFVGKKTAWSAPWGYVALVKGIQIDWATVSFENCYAPHLEKQMLISIQTPNKFSKHVRYIYYFAPFVVFLESKLVLERRGKRRRERPY